MIVFMLLSAESISIYFHVFHQKQIIFFSWLLFFQCFSLFNLQVWIITSRHLSNIYTYKLEDFFPLQQSDRWNCNSNLCFHSSKTNFLCEKNVYLHNRERELENIPTHLMTATYIFNCIRFKENIMQKAFTAILSLNKLTKCLKVHLKYFNLQLQ